MIVNKVSVHLRYSADTGAGSWRTVELGAEASLEGDETLHDATQELYGQVKAELAQIWHTPVKEQPAAAAPAPAPARGQASPQPAPAVAHWCSDHGVAFKQQSNERGSWFSHRVDQSQGGGWCREK